MSVLVAIVGGLGLAGTMGLNVLERTREIGVMRSIGATSTNISSIVVIEGLITGLVSFILAIPFSFPISYAFGFALGKALFGTPLSFAFEIQGVVIWFFVVTILSAVASFTPARKASLISIRDTLAYE